MAAEQARYQLAEELGGIEILNARYEKQNFSRHSHEGYTIGVIQSGAQQFYRTGGNHIAPQDSIILVNADEVHTGCSASEGGWSYQAMYPTPEQFEQLSQELGIKPQGAPYFSQAVVEDALVANSLRNTIATLEHSSNRLLRESTVYSSLSLLLSRHSKTRPLSVLKKVADSKLSVVKQFLDEQPEADVSLSELANLVNLSPCYLVKQFLKQYGIPPHAYQIQARLRLAKSFLRQGNKQLDVALDCGFHDQSHFSRHFKRALGITPGRYAKEFQA
ncbi:AraC family transcriptional regulator [Agarivorans sp. DSG3-1]|uniref:AraC family transcriptional regulator n=1 Tax=Agarivorans sp. DSG3-1 TaxID=3342249 RepID=UPI00398ECB86